MCRAEARLSRRDASTLGWQGWLRPFCPFFSPQGCPNGSLGLTGTHGRTLTGPGHLRLSAGMLLRDGCGSWRPKRPSRRRRSIQTSHGSVSKAGRDAESGAGTLSGPRWLCWGPFDSRATSLAEKPFPSAQRPRTAGEGGDYSSLQGLGLPGEEGWFPSLAPAFPPTRDGFLPR